MKRGPDPKSVKKIAVRMTNWVGDTVMNTPFLAEVRSLFPNARIVALGRKNVMGILENQPDVDELWTIDDRSLGGRLEAIKRLRRYGPDVAFALPNSLNAALLLRLGGSKRVVGYDRDGRRMLLTHPIRLRPEDLAVHEVRYYLRLLAPWGYVPREIPPLKLRVSEEELGAMRAYLGRHGVEEGQAVIGVNPAAFYGTAKRWLAERYAATAKRLAEENDARVFVTGLPTERDVAQNVCDAGGERFHNAAGEMSLRELMAFLALCRLFLTNDSGAMHVAAALGTPLVAVFGSTDWVTTAPRGEHAVIVREETACAPCLLRDCPIDHRCMTRVTVRSVHEESVRLLAKTAGA